MTILSQQLRDRLKPVVLSVLKDLPTIIKDMKDDDDATHKVAFAFRLRLAASELTREDLIFLATPSLVLAFTKTLDNVDYILDGMGAQPNDPQ